MRHGTFAPDGCVFAIDDSSSALKRCARPSQAKPGTRESSLARANIVLLPVNNVRGGFTKASSPFVETRSPPRKEFFLGVQVALALVGLGFPLIGYPVALIGDRLALIGDPITLGRDAITRTTVRLDSMRPLGPTAPDLGIDSALVLSRAPDGLLTLWS